MNKLFLIFYAAFVLGLTGCDSNKLNQPVTHVPVNIAGMPVHEHQYQLIHSE